MRPLGPVRNWMTAIALGAAPSCVAAQTTAVATDVEALAKALSNPVSSLISVPFQLNWDTGYGLDDHGDRWTLNVQPVVPIGLGEHWNLISRTILPLITQTGVDDGDSPTGLGDVVQSFFFSPKAPTASGWIWGVGPAFMLPTATDDAFASDQWSIGPTGVALKQTAGGWTYGALVNHLVSVAGEDARSDVNATFLQPFLAKGLGKGRTVTLNSESTYDWEHEQWNAPFNLTYSKVTLLGKQRLSWAAGARAYFAEPVGGPEWGLRFAVTLLFPK